MGREMVMDRREVLETIVSRRDLEDLDLIVGVDYRLEGPFSYRDGKLVKTESGQFYRFILIEKKYMF